MRSMGLRAQSLAWVLAFTVGVGGLGVATLSAYLTRSFEQIELEAMAGDMKRLVGTLADAVKQRGRAAREWSHWTEMRNHLRQPSAAFAAENLTSGSVRTSGLAWLGLLDLQGNWLQQIAAEADVAAGPVGRRLLDPARAAHRVLARVPEGLGRCGLTTVPELGPQPLVICHVPVRDSSGAGEPAGTLLTLERLTPDMLKSMGEAAALDFSLAPVLGPVPGWQALQELRTVQGSGTLWLLPGRVAHRLRWQLLDLADQPVAWAELRWPRELRRQTDTLLWGARLLFLALAFCLALGALLFVEWRLVRRLHSLARQMARARKGQDWALQLRVRGHDEISELAEEGNHLLGVIQTHLRALEQRAMTDPLTGLANRRAFDPTLSHALARSARNGTPLCMLMVDADHFKQFNDRHGHAAGDQALKALAECMRQAQRPGVDLAARLGGEEFALLIEGLKAPAAVAVAESLRRALAALPDGPGQALAQPLTVSIGVAERLPEEPPSGLMARADAALYRAKQGGRNRVVLAE